MARPLPKVSPTSNAQARNSSLVIFHLLFYQRYVIHYPSFETFRRRTSHFSLKNKIQKQKVKVHLSRRQRSLIGIFYSLSDIPHSSNFRMFVIDRILKYFTEEAEVGGCIPEVNLLVNQGQ